MTQTLSIYQRRGIKINISGRTSLGFYLIYTHSFIDVANHNNTWTNYCRYMVRFVESVWALCVKSLTRYGCEILNLFRTRKGKRVEGTDDVECIFSG